jgi:hypothetical protein
LSADYVELFSYTLFVEWLAVFVSGRRRNVAREVCRTILRARLGNRQDHRLILCVICLNREGREELDLDSNLNLDWALIKSSLGCRTL